MTTLVAPRATLIIGLTLSLMLMSRAAHARTIYVDFAGGPDAQDGLSPDHAFKHSPGDSTAIAVAGAMALQPGDEVCFNGGVSYRGSIVVRASGTEGQPIVYDGNTQGNFGTGRAILDDGPAVGLWSGKPIERILFLNNLILNTADGAGIYSVNKVLTDCVFQNNIMGDFTGEAAIDAKADIFRNNIYLRDQQRLYGASDRHAGAQDLFVNPAQEDYHLKPGSAAVDAGAAPDYPAAAWPAFDFTSDRDGRPRKQGTAVASARTSPANRPDQPLVASW